LAELLIVVGLTAIVGTVGLVNFYGLKRAQELEAAALRVRGILKDAQQLSITQEEGKKWGVRFDANPAGRDHFLLFASSTAGFEERRRFSLNTILELDQGQDLIFSQVSGRLESASATKNVIIRFVNDTNTSTTITVYENGRID
jgi:type II secretory pathway pseudopilin PulG